jgi:hypothetical protein
MEKTEIKNLEDAFAWLDSLNVQDVQEWLNNDEDKAVGLAHHGFGTMIRNELDLWHNGSIVSYFNNLGIYHADDMSGIILTSFHRNKNGKELNIDEQVNKYVDY